MTAYKFRFRNKTNDLTDLPLVWATAKKKTKIADKQTTGKAFVIAVADLQVGKVDQRGGTAELLQRVFASYDRIEEKLRKGKYERVLIVDVGDIVEGFSNKADMQQTFSNDLSIMQQVDVALSLIWDLMKRASKYCGDVSYISVASNHCQFRLNKQQVGKPGQDDWGVMIAKQIHRLAIETQTPVQVLIPDPNDESLAVDVFSDGFHVLGVWHGHQSGRPDGVPTWWRQQAFGNQPVAAATIGLTGHFHHLRVQELGASSNGGSRFWIQSSTMDSGSGWFRLTAGEDSSCGITCFELNKNERFTGSVWKL